MKFAITVTLLVSLLIHVGAVNNLATRSVVHSPPPPLLVAGNAIVDINGMLSDRILQGIDDVVDCPICGRMGLPLLPYVIPFPDDYPEFTCGMANSNEIFRNVIENQYLLPKCAMHQSSLEEVCCDIPQSPDSLSLHECEENVLNELLEPGYRKSITPRMGREPWVSVDTLVKVYATSEISITDSTVDMFVEINLTWKDPRLAWNFTVDNCATSTFVRASLDAEVTDIWVPSLDLLNRKEGVQTFAQAPAQIYSDGTVVWIRGGKISAFCTFVGLARMPFDTLGCQFLFGDTLPRSTVYNLVDVTDGPQGVIFPPYTRTYSEYVTAKDKTTSTSDGVVFGLQIYWNRSGRQYIDLVIWPTILFVYISFGQFFYSATSGERVAFSINALLIIVAQNIISSSLLPFCEEKIWLNSLTTTCQVFVLAGIFEALFLYSLVEKKQKKPFDDNGEGCATYGTLTASESIVAAHRVGELMRIPKFARKAWKSLRKRLLRIMLLVDSTALFLFPTAFTLYLIVMFTTLDKWDDDPFVVWGPN
eukprot:CAMPEP_0198256736 /NCGR_PEP_ID=MMETSP1447-20131203/6561_1 /TAXON_ID=420782 /ORGANISM="Chaetoceros dichaeta, Strain CCMP1751" /LENGTH=533 /DNA_ID=CAMNT_0043943437 /DNA_START=86 /DNA_END=1687 /DNA_ORIENTATION=-